MVDTGSKELQINVTSYDIHESYANLQFLTALEKEAPTNIYRGSFLLNDAIKPTSEEFLNEVVEWLKQQKFEIFGLHVERFAHPCATIYAKRSGAFLRVIFNSDSLVYDLYVKNYAESALLLTTLEGKFKSNKKSVNGSIPFAFWQQDPDDGCEASNSSKQCPSLEEISDNYPASLIKQVKNIISLEKPYNHGKIILYHGAAGNGKTYLLRALARAWHENYGTTPEVIIDPENLYESPKYLTNLLLNGNDRIYSSKTEPPFRLIIAEDCAQIFGVDSRNQTGFSRLLNTVDGLLGQGQKIIFIFTANEKISEIDQAILRPGRCLQNIEITNWTQATATKWFKNKGIENLKLPNELSLAEMYAILNKTMHAEQQRSTLGF